MKVSHFTRIFQGLCLAIVFAKTKQEDLCGLMNGRAIYLQLGERGTIVHTNSSKSYMYRCSAELITCPSCSIEIKINNINISQSCLGFRQVNSTKDPCPCGALNIWEPSSSLNARHICTMPSEPIFKTTTRTVSVSFDYANNRKPGIFSISYEAKKNRDNITGTIGKTGVFSSPHFPAFYPRDFGMEHILTCNTKDCVISVIFSDFLLSPSSIVEFYDMEDKPIELFTGLVSRPQQIISNGPSLTMRFFGNGGTSLGYKAFYEFFNSTENKIVKPNLECGGEVDNIGGSIYMEGVQGSYDCVWIIQPYPSISLFKTHIYVKVLNFSADGILTIHSGMTSESDIIEVSVNSKNVSDEHIVPISKGFYISFYGQMHETSTILIAYSSFSYVDCLPAADVLCENKRCVSSILTCNSIDNCGDNSDETDECEGKFREIPIQYWWPIRNNNNQNGTVGGGALIGFGAALVGAALILAGTLCRVALRVRPNSHMQLHEDHTRTIAHLINISELEDSDDPPVYEPPPEYSQVVKPIRPRRKRSTQRLLKKDTSSQVPAEHGEFSENSMPLEIKLKQEPSAIQHVKDLLNNKIRRHLPDNSPPLSLETTGYDEDFGVSLTLSTSSTKGNNPDRRQWISSTSNKSFNESASAASFDTLRSSQEKILHPLFKCHSQDNMLLSYNKPNLPQSISCRNFYIKTSTTQNHENDNSDDSKSNESKENVSL